MTDQTMGGRPITILQTFEGEILERGEGRSRLRYPVLDRFKNPMGVLQGGVFAVMMDTAMAVAADGLHTSHLNVYILRPATEGHVIVTGEVVKSGRRIVYCEAEVRDESGELLAKGTQNGVPRNP